MPRVNVYLPKDLYEEYLELRDEISISELLQWCLRDVIRMRRREADARRVRERV
jgi:hypothetical protein